MDRGFVMGKQINFLMDEETEKRFVEFILSEGDIWANREGLRPEKIKILPKAFSEKGWFQVYFHKIRFGVLKIEELEKGEGYIDSISSPVIEFSRTIIRQKDMSRGRLWVEIKVYDEEGKTVLKSKELDDWYKKLSKWVKKNLPKTTIVTQSGVYTEYSCESINELIKSGYKVIN